MDELLDIAKNGNGYVTSAQATSCGIPRRCLSEAVEVGALVQVDRGLYATPETWDDPYLIAQHRFSKGIFSDGTALFLHELTDRAPFQLTMTFPRNYNKTNAKKSGIICRSCSDDVFELGVVEVTTIYGNPVRAYDVERTLCDVLRGQRVIDDQLVTPAMQSYVKKRGRDPVKLIDYARALGVEEKVRTYLRVLL